MTETKITFAPHLNMPLEDERLVLNWPTMRSQINERNQNGFETHEVTVNGVSIRNIGGVRKVLMAQTTVDYTFNGIRSQYGVNFISDAATLLVVFRVTQKEITESAQPTIQHHVLMVKQARWGMNYTDGLEIPGGMLTDEENFDIGASKGALREFIEETGFDDISQGNVRSLGKPMYLHPALSDVQHQFYTEIDVTKERFDALGKYLNGRHSGNASEGETTTVKILPLNDVYNRSLDEGNNPGVTLALARYKKILRRSVRQSPTKSHTPAL